jgi:chromosome segregation ATPase
MNRVHSLAARAAAFSMALVTAAGSMAIPARADAPQVEVDETMYVNADYYGVSTSTSVVKSVGMNGLTQFTDHGYYSKITNMTDNTEPEVNGDTVTWNVPEGTNRFYYEGSIDNNAVQLPWNVDVSYKLNGQPADASKLNHASGLVEIDVNAVHNTQAKEYYQNNMILTVIVPVDMGKCYSVDAPGSQTQNMGSTTGVMFMALPGEDGNFTVRLGTDDFSCSGIYIAMVPGTLSDLDRIKSLNEAKDRFRDAGDDLFDSMTDLMKSMEAMKSDVQVAQSGAQDLQSARNTVNGSRHEIEGLSTEALNEMQSAIDQTNVVIPYLETARDAVMDINADADTMSSTMGDLQDSLDDLYPKLGRLGNALSRASGNISSNTVSDAEREKSVQEVREIINEINQLQAQLKKDIANGQAQNSEVKQRLADLNKQLQKIDSFRYAKQQAQQKIMASAAELVGPENAQRDLQELELAKKQAEDRLKELDSAYPQKIQKMTDDVDSILESAGDADEKLDDAISQINTALGNAATVAGRTADVVNELKGATDQVNYLLDDGKMMISTVDNYVPSMLDSLSDTEELMNRLTTALGGTHAVLSKINDTCIAAGDDLDAGTRKSLDAIQGTLGKTMATLNDIGGVREASDTMKQQIDNQLDDIENETNFLNIDPDALKVSFTSDSNPEPKSLQIIMRTEEIDDESEATDISDQETEDAKDSPFTRIANIFKMIFEAIKNFFT